LSRVSGTQSVIEIAPAQKIPRAEEKPSSPASICKFQSGEEAAQEDCEEKEGKTLNMPDKEGPIDFDAPAILRK
jgi:hypothetical protein